MKISDVMKETRLTRKAIYYYEAMGLINPIKEEDNSYRSYSDCDVERLKQIKLLRLLDFSLEKIKKILDSHTAFNDIMGEHLEIIKERINLLNETEKIIRTLLESNSSMPQSDKLSRLNHYLELDAKSKNDYMKKELERIFPSGFGKLIAIMYGVLLDEPINSIEKEQAWEKLINLLDETEIIQFPDDINNILNKLYEKILQEGIEHFESPSNKIINNVNSFNGNISNEEKESINKQIEESKKQEGYNEMYQMSKTLFEYIKENPNILPKDFSEHLKVLSSKYSVFGENFLKAFKSKYTIGKTFGSN